MSRQSEIGGLGWALRHYAAVVLAILVVATALATLMAAVSRQDAQYEATSLVVANDVRLRPEQVPRFAQSVFDSGAVAQTVAQREGLDQDYRTLRPSVIWMDPVPESITFLVHGRSPDPVQAARLANSASLAFVEELNKVGQDVGTFSVQDTADAPLAPTPTGLGTSLAVMIALAAGGLISLAVVWLLYSTLQPVTSGAEAADAAGVPLLAEVALPRRLSSSGLTPTGLRRLAGHLQRSGADAVALAGPERSRPFREQLVAELERLPGADHLRSTILLPDADDIPLPSTRDAMTVVVVVPIATPARQVRQVCQDFMPEEVLGVVLVQRAPTVRSRGVGARHTVPRTVPEPRVGAQPGVLAADYRAG